MNANLRNFALWVIIVLLLLALFTLFQNPGQRTTSQDVSFSQLLNEVDQGRVRDVLIQGPDIHGTFTDGRTFQTYAPSDPSLVQRLYNKGVSITARPQTDNVPWFVSLLISWLPFVALIGVWIFLSRQMQGAGGKALGFGKSRAKQARPSGDRRIPARPGQVPAARWTHSARRIAGRPARHRQDTDRARRRRRGERAVLHHFRF
jgi:cell division protease FtsH